MFQLAQQFDFGEDDQKLVDTATLQWKGITQSKLVEDGVRDERAVESSPLQLVSARLGYGKELEGGHYNNYQVSHHTLKPLRK